MKTRRFLCVATALMLVSVIGWAPQAAGQDLTTRQKRLLKTADFHVSSVEKSYSRLASKLAQIQKTGVAKLKNEGRPKR